MGSLKTTDYLIALIIAGCIVFSFWADMRLYKKNKSKVDAHVNAQKIYPQKTRFVFAWIIYSLLFCLPVIPIFWLLEHDNPVLPAIGLYLVFLFSLFSVYPYYTLTKDEEKITGATLWSWMWRREEIKFSEIDSDKIQHRNFGRLLSITVLFSKQGKKILTLGLSRSQISEILKSAQVDGK